ncbi:tetratricopeptide repeat protein [Solibacillus sp. FSL K6-4121]|uniref:tetratricopeptide repeat protein n=1 Tax=Solibacillus sp. FSL K6-4121 TaxID=2921505 RepID=UPI0030F55203
MQNKESTRKYILLGLVILIVVGIVSAKVLASKQDEVFKYEDMLYQQAVQLFQEGNNEDASYFINELLLKKPDSEVANYLGGLIAAGKGEYNQAVILLQKSLDLNPHKVEDPMFMIQFAEVLFFAEKYLDSKIVLEQCRDWGWTPETYPNYQERVMELLNQIDNM